ncbi:hypothetical protein YC2023_054772 [Brassica napus]
MDLLQIQNRSGGCVREVRLITSLILLQPGYTVGLVVLLRGTDLNCSWCHYLSCIPTSLWNCKSQNVYCEVNSDFSFLPTCKFMKIRIIVGLVQSSQIGRQMNLTCNAYGRTEMYRLSNDNPSHVQQLCSQLCS